MSDTGTGIAAVGFGTLLHNFVYRLIQKRGVKFRNISIHSTHMMVLNFSDKQSDLKGFFVKCINSLLAYDEMKYSTKWSFSSA